MLIVIVYLAVVFIWFFIPKIQLRWLLFLTFFGLAAIWRYPSWVDPFSLNSDEAEWLVLANRVEACPVPFECFNPSTSGFLNILMLRLLPAIGLELNYLNLRVFAFVFLVIPTSIFLFLGIKNWYSEETAYWVAPWLGVLMIFGFYDKEYLSYNTEYPLMFFFALVFLLFSIFRKKNYYHTKSILLLSLILGLLPYVKLQSVPFVFAWYSAVFFILLRKRSYKHLILFHVGLVAATIIFGIWFYAAGILNHFYRMYIEANVYYVNHRITKYMFGSTELIHRLRTFKNMNMYAFWPLYFALLPVAVYLFIQLFKNKSKIIIDIIVVWVFLWVCYSTYTTGNGFGHYNVLLLVPIVYLIGNIYHQNLNKNIKPLKILTFLVLLLPIVVYSMRLSNIPFETEKGLSPTEKFILTKTVKKEPVLFLGWLEALESQLIATRLLPTRNATYQYISIGDTSLREYYQSGFFQDIKSSRPRYVIDMKAVLEMPGLVPVKNFIYKYYRLDTVIDGNVIYKIKNKKHE